MSCCSLCFLLIIHTHNPINAKCSKGKNSLPASNQTLSPTTFTAMCQKDAAALLQPQYHVNREQVSRGQRHRRMLTRQRAAFLTSAPWDRIFFLRPGEGAADCKGVRPPFFHCSPEGDFGTVHTGAPSEKR